MFWLLLNKHFFFNIAVIIMSMSMTMTMSIRYTTTLMNNVIGLTLVSRL